MTDHIQIARSDRTLEIRFARADKKNALTGAMYRSMTEALQTASTDPQIRAVLFTGEGGAFTAGNDLGDFLNGPDGAMPAFAFIRALAAFEKPLVASVRGLAVGIGTTMLFHCDLVYASPDARFTMPFVNLGVVPEAAASLLAPQRLGHAKASAMLLLGEPMDAKTADTVGLVTALVVEAELDDVARAKAAALCLKPPAALAAARRLMRGDTAPILQRIDEEATLFATALESDDAREAFAAFLEKRPPVFLS
ncbi:enoyl-CoA hydratase [Sphingomonas sp. BIUV-7]|uniref:Enoyl-CoA hydratase n=1 Tax=Sphingomonas natans TaxID=3063330 RepID=A0ABT8Y7Y4_9SPHN|nr:enoyl-CoA hydratase [Sphingomonas sp. BIUV-7]MDO6414441.1 enoyl-CoA hydratase [Sphingomonas sp. BIUV-7]